MAEDRWLSLKQAAETTNYDVASLRRLAIEGTLPAEKIGNQWAIRESRLRRWMASDSYHPGKGRPVSKR